MNGDGLTASEVLEPDVAGAGLLVELALDVPVDVVLGPPDGGEVEGLDEVDELVEVLLGADEADEAVEGGLPGERGLAEGAGELLLLERVVVELDEGVEDVREQFAADLLLERLEAVAQDLEHLEDADEHLVLDLVRLLHDGQVAQRADQLGDEFLVVDRQLLHGGHAREELVDELEVVLRLLLVVGDHPLQQGAREGLRQKGTVGFLQEPGQVQLELAVVVVHQQHLQLRDQLRLVDEVVGAFGEQLQQLELLLQQAGLRLGAGVLDEVGEHLVRLGLDGVVQRGGSLSEVDVEELGEDEGVLPLEHALPVVEVLAHQHVDLVLLDERLLPLGVLRQLQDDLPDVHRLVHVRLVVEQLLHRLHALEQLLVRGQLVQQLPHLQREGRVRLQQSEEQ